MSLISSRNLVSGTIVIAAIVAVLAGVPPASAQNFHIGTATDKLTPCPSDPNGVSGTCYGLNISGCPNPPTLPYDATAKVSSPTGASIGTIIFLSGAVGTHSFTMRSSGRRRSR